MSSRRRTKVHDANGHPEATTSQPVNNRPSKPFSCSICSGVFAEASVWPRTIQFEGKDVVVYSVNVRKNYKAEDGTWKHTTYFRGNELAVVRFLLEAAEKWILQRRTTEEPDGELPF